MLFFPVPSIFKIEAEIYISGSRYSDIQLCSHVACIQSKPSQLLEATSPSLLQLLLSLVRNRVNGLVFTFPLNIKEEGHTFNLVPFFIGTQLVNHSSEAVAISHGSTGTGKGRLTSTGTRVWREEEGMKVQHGKKKSPPSGSNSPRPRRTQDCV